MDLAPLWIILGILAGGVVLVALIWVILLLTVIRPAFKALINDGHPRARIRPRSPRRPGVRW